MEDNECSSLDRHDMVESSDNVQDNLMHLAHVTKSGGRMLVGNVLKCWAEVSRNNYLENFSWTSRRSSVKPRSLAIACKELHTMPSLSPNGILKKTEEIITEVFPNKVTSLMNEEQLWGCFYNFPELYDDVYSPVTRVLSLRDVPELVEGVLTRDMVAACLTYLRRTPILGDYVYIKLNLQGKRLLNIDVLQHYKYLVYLDLSSNLLKDIKVLSHLLYLQYLSVDFNRLETVLEYSTPQWFLTEVHYKYNSVKSIRDLDMFWSITILDLSRNNIKNISGLESLKYLRHLDLSFNHIQRLENLNHLRLLWLDVSYNNISSFELGTETGLWTLLHLDYLNLSENNLKSMKMFSGCTRLCELHLRNNGMSSLLELAVYMRQLRRLTVLDLRANPISTATGYADVIFNTFPLLLNLDATEIDPVLQRSSKMDTLPDVNTFASRRLLRLLYVEQLSRARVPVTPPADTQEVPLVVLVGQEAVGKGTLAHKLAAEYNSKIKYARQHTTAIFQSQEHYILVSQQKFDDMILAGEFLSYSEIDGDSYGLSREEAFISDGKVCVCCMDLIGALMLKMRGRRPYLILTFCHDKIALAAKQLDRKTARIKAYETLMSTEPHQQQSTLAVLLSGRIIMNGILNEIIMSLPEEKGTSEFALGSECSLLNSQVQSAKQRAKADVVSLLGVSSDDSVKSCRTGDDTSLQSIYKQSQGSSVAVTASFGSSDERKNKKDAKKTGGGDIRRGSAPRFEAEEKPQEDRRRSSMWKGYMSTKSSKSVTFTTTTGVGATSVEPPPERQSQVAVPKPADRSISAKLPQQDRSSPDDMDLWLAFLTETGVLTISDTVREPPNLRSDNRSDDPDSIITQLNYYHKTAAATLTSNVRDDYEDIHRLCPGLFRDTIAMDDPTKAFHKAKQIIRDIVNSQTGLSPMFDIEFTNNLHHYPTVEQRLEDIRKEIAPRQLFC